MFEGHEVGGAHVAREISPYSAFFAFPDCCCFYNRIFWQSVIWLFAYFQHKSVNCMRSEYKIFTFLRSLAYFTWENIFRVL